MQPLKITEAVFFGGEPFLKLAPRLGIVFARNRRMSDLIHATIMDQVELNG
jgi:hypothetical protein